MGKQKEEITMQSILEQYVKDESGSIFHVLQHNTKPHLCLLRTGNKYVQKPILEIRQGLVNGTWSSVNEHEWKKWVAEDNAYVEAFTIKLIKRTIMAQLLLELDDELIVDFEDNKYFRGLLEKSNKECERIASKSYDRLYGADKSMSQNLMNLVDEFTTKAAGLAIHDFPYLNNMVDKYLENPEEYKKDPVYFTKID